MNEPNVGEGDGTIVIHNAEQQQIMGVLGALRLECQSLFVEVEEDARENESLAGMPVDYDLLTCDRAERWIDSEGNLGWRCYITGPGATQPKLLAAISDKLRNRDWEGIQVVTG